jgi:hypothetical protein
MDIEMESGSIYLGKDAATGKKEIVLCGCKGKLYIGTLYYQGTYTGRFTLKN